MEALTQFLGTGQYTGASSSQRWGRKWWPFPQSADADTLPDLETLRGRARDLARNAPTAGGALNTVVTSVAGRGLRLASTIDRDVLGLSDEQARNWERRAERLWRLWAKDCDVTRHQTFAGVQGLTLRSQLESGDLLVVRRFFQRRNELFGTKLQLIEADRISTPTTEREGDDLRAGVELDGFGAPRRFHVRNRHEHDVLRADRVLPEWTAIPAYSRSTGERLAFLLFDKTRPGQTRGVPYLAPVIQSLKQLERYTEAELAAAVLSSFLTVFVKSMSDQGFANEETSGDTTQYTDDQTAQSPTRDIHLAEGAIVDLAPDEDIEVVNPKRPNSTFDPFVTSVMRQVGVALELPVDVLMKNFQASYSAARGALLEAWRFYRRRRHFLATDFCDPVYEWVITEAVQRGYLDAPGFFADPLMRAAWLGAKWTGDAQGHVQPMQEANAIVTRVENGLISMSDAVADDNGGDYETILRQRSREQALREELGVDLGNLRTGSPPELDDEDNGDIAEGGDAA